MASAKMFCVGLGVGSMSSFDCSSEDRPNVVVGDKGVAVSGSTTYVQCNVTVACAKPRRICALPADPAGVSRQ